MKVIANEEDKNYYERKREKSAHCFSRCGCYLERRPHQPGLVFHAGSLFRLNWNVEMLVFQKYGNQIT